MQSVTLLALEVIVIHTLVGLEVPDDLFNGLVPLQLHSLLHADVLTLAPVHDLHLRVPWAHTAIAQIDERYQRFDAAVLHQDSRLFQ